ncbi:imidazoleglycerol-phosphate dehydratase HisB [Candidatus Woesearchaeota archaeon]|nr:imidazoleglycerol-phosphate dehydratase HisB [Candidatus Woesearchaeota archaeon]
MRKVKIERKTRETRIICEINIDGKGRYRIKTPIGFFSHMLELFSKHSLMDMKLDVKGDIHVDQHHTVEDAGIVIGTAVLKALGNRKGINRAGYFIMPMDESLAVVAIDISGRPFLKFDADLAGKTSDFETCLVEEFFRAVANTLKANIHIRLLYGRNDHHKIEAIFKAFAKAMKTAASKDKRLAKELPSTKGLLD